MSLIEEPQPNLPLLRKVLDHIDAHPDEHNQNLWGFESEAQTDCGTACCIAGHALLMTGHTITGYGFASPEGKRVSVTPAAAQELGLNSGEACGLFYAGNSRADLQSIAVEIAARAGEVL